MHCNRQGSSPNPRVDNRTTTSISQARQRMRAKVLKSERVSRVQRYSAAGHVSGQQKHHFFGYVPRSRGRDGLANTGDGAGIGEAGESRLPEMSALRLSATTTESDRSRSCCPQGQSSQI